MLILASGSMLCRRSCEILSWMDGKFPPPPPPPPPPSLAPSAIAFCSQPWKRSNRRARKSGGAASGARANICGAAAVAVAAAANCNRAISSGEHSIAADVECAYATVASTKKSKCFATASRPVCAAATAPPAARRKCNHARCVLSSKSSFLRSNGVPPAARSDPTPPLSAPCNGASAARSCGAASAGTRASTAAAAAACAPPSRKHGTSSAKSPLRDPRFPTSVCCTLASDTDAPSSSDGDAAHTKHVQFRHISNFTVLGSIGARGPAVLCCSPSCIMIAWTRCNACARAVVVTSGLSAAALDARTPRDAHHAPPWTCPATAAAPAAAA
eukprot:29120-Pelagococcus_subviridis.AAC.1